ncbi:DUF1810 family protein [Mucilaginibacter sp.]|uniref:DUF1810 family protein n=1 Tax=Mucilaginibacter sp. TaxID=1882438 RepID=UPI0026277B2B|nr:DUF1810 family protein [Mucilaginibacter sp.]
MSELQRFIDAQALIYSQALSEIRNGRKRSHWIWFVFPQLKGLGYSHNAIYYGIDDLQEAQDYLQHPILGQTIDRDHEGLAFITHYRSFNYYGAP